MTTEDKLKEFILTRYKSLREFTQSVDIPYTTVRSILERGIGNSSVTNVIRICNALNISVDALANGEIEYRTYKSESETHDVREIINDVKTKLSYGEHLTIDGNVIDIEYVEPIINALDIGYEMSRQKSKVSKTKKADV